MALQELIYTSVSSAGDDSDGVKNILDASERNNVTTSITGLLMFDGQRYIQVLEGETQDVDTLYEVIAQDPRHAQPSSGIIGRTCREYGGLLNGAKWQRIRGR